MTNKPAQGAKILKELIEEEYQTDPFPEEVLSQLANGTRHSKKITLADYGNVEGKLNYLGKLFVPDLPEAHLELLRQPHNAPAAGRPGKTKTFELLTKNYYWPQMMKYVEQYVKNCHTCSDAKATRHAPFGIFRPLPIPEQPWRDISMDFVTGLPVSDYYDAILVVVDRLTKM